MSGRWMVLAALTFAVGCGFEHGSAATDAHVVDVPTDVPVDVPVFSGQVGFDEFTDGEVPFANSLTKNHTVGSNAKRLLLVAVATSSTFTTVTDITYGGVALARVGAQDATQGRLEIWKLADPASGTAPVAITLSNNGSTVTIGIGSFYNVHPTIPVSPLAGAAGTQGNPTVTIASGAGDIVETVAVWRDANTTLTTPQTLQWERVMANQIGAGSTTAGAAMVTPSFTVVSGANAPWAIGAIAVHPGG